MLVLNDWDSHIIYKKKMHCGLFGNAFFLFFTEVLHVVQVLHKVQPSLYLS